MQSSIIQLQQILLCWDYWQLADRTQEGEGAMANLKAVPDTFASIQVSNDKPTTVHVLLALCQALAVAFMYGIEYNKRMCTIYHA